VSYPHTQHKIHSISFLLHHSWRN